MKKFLLTALAVIMAATVGAKAEDNDVTVLLDTDFSVFTEGSIQSPVSIPYTSAFTSKVSGYYMISKVSQAGGCIFIDPNGYITANTLSGYTFPTGGATVRITAQVKMGDSYGGAISFTPGYSGTVSLAVEGNEWTTVQAFVPSVTSSTRIKISPYLSVSGLYIKSLKIEVSPNFIASPVAYLPNDATGTSFTASCSLVTGAASYEADVFTLDAEGNPVYAQQNVVLKKASTYSSYASAKISDLDASKQYYYVARALLSNGAKSDDSEVVKVIKCITSIDAPVATAATDVTENGFTANWEAVNDAAYYMLNVFSTIKLDTDTKVSIFEEDFEGVNIGTVSSIEFGGYINDYTKVQGWGEDTTTKAFAKGYYVIYPSTSGYVTTPVIDLSGDGGKFDFVVNAAAGAFGSFYITENTIVAELLEGETVVETSEAKKVDNKNFTDYTFSFTKGSANSRIKLTYTLADGSSYKLYIDDIKLEQMVAAGNEYRTQILSVAVEDGTSKAVTIENPTAGATYSYTVNAIGETVVGSYNSAQMGEITSSSSNEITVKDAGAGVDNVVVEKAATVWKAADGVIGVNGNHVVIADLQGHILYNGFINGNAEIALNVKGLIVVVVDGSSYKIVL